MSAQQLFVHFDFHTPHTLGSVLARRQPKGKKA